MQRKFHEDHEEYTWPNIEWNLQTEWEWAKLYDVFRESDYQRYKSRSQGEPDHASRLLNVKKTKATE